MQASKSLNYRTLTFVSLLYILAVGGLYFAITYGLTWPEIIFGIVSYLLGGFGITALYHRSWTHNAVQFSRPMEWFLALGSVFLLQNDARTWIGDHVRHHQHTDHEGDPHNINEGFWWAHQTWMMFDRSLEAPRLPARLENNPVLLFQHRYYFWLSFVLNVLLPALIAYASGHPWWAGILLNALRLLILNHVIYSVNSLCHTMGSSPFGTANTARNVWWFPFMLGEQYHNYHHAFPRDYRNGIAAHDFDPTKWLIWLLWKARLASEPFAMPVERITAARQAAQTQ